MRIVYLHQYFNTPLMAGSTRSYDVASRLVHRGHSVDVVTSLRDGTAARSWRTTDEGGINVHWLPVPYSNEMDYRDRMRAFLRFAYRSAWKASSIGGDVVFATSTPLTIAIPAVFAARRNRIPMVFEVRDLWPTVPIALGALRSPLSRWLAQQLERFAYRNATQVIALSPGMAEGVKRAGYPEERITVIPNASDLDLFWREPGRTSSFRRKHPELGAGPIVLYAGTLGTVNGVEYFVELAAVTLEVAPMVRFVIIGTGRERERIVARALETGVLNENLFVYAPMPKEALAEAFSAAAVTTSLFIDLCELEANSANKFFDGLAAGAPVAINYGGWQADLLEETNAGIRLSRDAQIASQQILHLLSDPALLSSMGCNARRLAEERFSSDQLGRGVEGVLTAALGGGQR
jgi:glycosyltransferase involved in cell wall biosynthesis